MPGIRTVFPCPSCLRPQCTTNGVRSGRARYCPCSRATLRTILSSRREIVSKQCYAWCMLHLQTGSCSRRLRVLLAIWHQMLSGFSCRRAAEPGSHDRYLRNAVTPPLGRGAKRSQGTFDKNQDQCRHWPCRHRRHASYVHPLLEALDQSVSHYYSLQQLLRTN